MLTIILATILIIIITYLFYTHKTERSPKGQLPPGPRGLPIIGSMLSLVKDPHIQYGAWARQFGDIYSIRVCSLRVVFLNTPELIREAFQTQGHAFSHRLPLYRLVLGRDWFESEEEKKMYEGGIVLNSGPSWTEQRRFSLRCLRDLGFGKVSSEVKIREEIVALSEEMRKLRGVAVSNDTVRELLQISFSNNVSCMVSGDRYTYSDPKNTDYFRILKIQNTLAPLLLMLLFPVIRSIWPSKYLLSPLVKLVKSTNEYFQGKVEEHEKTLDEANPRDFIDAYLVELHKGSRLSQDHLSTTIAIDLFLAAIDSLSTTLEWSILYMAHYPEIQREVQEELWGVTGGTRLPTLEDKPHLPLTEACCLEVLRLGRIPGVSFPHVASQDAQLGGYLIPKGTVVFGNFMSIQTDERYWHNPLHFDPQRFINADGQVASKPRAFLPFSTGKRSCLGEPLAKMSQFLYFSSLLHDFSFTFPHDLPPASSATEGDLLLTFRPKPYHICITPRRHLQANQNQVQQD